MTDNTTLDFKLDIRLCKKCGICYGLCPRGVLKPGEHGEPVVENSENCIFCMLCEMRCPDYAIRVRRKKE